MRRRDFLKTIAAGGLGGVLCESACTETGSLQDGGGQDGDSYAGGPGFDLNPLIKKLPEAVFIHQTGVSSIFDEAAIRGAAQALAQQLIVKTSSGGFTVSTPVIVKPNWTRSDPQGGKPVPEKLGVSTDTNFVQGWVQGMRDAGPGDFYIRECSNPKQWKDMGWTDMARQNNIDFRDLSTKDVWRLKEGPDLTFVEVPGGVVFKKVAYMAPVNSAGSFLVNIAKFKAHYMGITGTVKNLQGLCARRFHTFCIAPDKIFSTYETAYHKYFHQDLLSRVTALWQKHVKNGIPRWDRSGEEGGLWMEQWCQRTLDSVSVTPTALNVVEAIYGQDGNGFGIGPHQKSGQYGVTSRDYLTNMVLFGLDPFRVDMVAHWLAGHEPGNFGLFHLAIERGLSRVLDPRDIPVYLWKGGQATRTQLAQFKRTPLVSPYLRRDGSTPQEAEYHLCDEPVDYLSWKQHYGIV